MHVTMEEVYYYTQAPLFPPTVLWQFKSSPSFVSVTVCVYSPKEAE